MIPPGDGGYLARLSSAALDHVAALETEDPSEIAAALYSYHRFPATADWCRRLPSRDSVAEYLGVGRNPALGELWVRAPALAKDTRWFIWWRRLLPRAGPAPFKLYISPHSSELEAVFGATIAEVSERGAVSCKVASDVYGLLRPDKLTVCFATYENLARAASALEARIGGARVHGVPFSSQLDARGLLSWGLERLPSPSQSWRRWIGDRLAALFVAAGPGPAERRWRLALQRIASEGVDPTTWTPVLLPGRSTRS